MTFNLGMLDDEPIGGGLTTTENYQHVHGERRTEGRQESRAALQCQNFNLL